MSPVMATYEISLFVLFLYVIGSFDTGFETYFSSLIYFFAVIIYIYKILTL